MHKRRISFKDSRRRRRFSPLALVGIFATLAVVLLGVAAWLIVPRLNSRAAFGSPADGYGLYESCTIFEPACLHDLTVMSQGGFKEVLNYTQMYGRAQDQLAYANTAASLGMKVIWSLDDPAFLSPMNGNNLLRQYDTLSPTCGCNTNAGFITYFVNLVKNNPGTWGYYIADEVSTSSHAQVKALAKLIQSADPSHPRLIVLGSNGPTLNTDLVPFTDSADVIAQDIYPIGDAQGETLSSVGAVSQQVQTLASQHGLQSGMVVQTSSLGEYSGYSAWCSPFPSCMPYPSLNDMTTEKNEVVQHSTPRIVLWYSYFDLVKSGNFTKHWNDLAAAITSGTPGPVSAPTNTPTPTPILTPTPTQQVTPTTGGTPVPALPTSGSATWIYKGGIAPGWVDWSWDSTVNLADTTHSSSGGPVLAWTQNQGYSGLYLHTWAGVKTTGHTLLTFSLQVTDTNEQLLVTLIGSQGRLLQYVPLTVYGGGQQAGNYGLYTIPLSALRATNMTITGFEIQNQTPQGHTPLYLDAIGLQ